MKTIHLLCSIATIVIMTVVLGGIYPPPPEAHAQSTVSKAVEAPQKSETVNVPSTAVEAKIDVPAQATPRVLNEHETWMQQAGIPEGDWQYVDNAISRESGWCATKWEGEIGYCPAYHGIPSSGGYGLCQSTPAHKMSSMGAGWETEPIVQLKWCYQYGQGYGSWAAAIQFRDCLGSCYSPRTGTTEYKRTTWF